MWRKTLHIILNTACSWWNMVASASCFGSLSFFVVVFSFYQECGIWSELMGKNVARATLNVQQELQWNSLNRGIFMCGISSVIVWMFIARLINLCSKMFSLLFDSIELFCKEAGGLKISEQFAVTFPGEPDLPWCQNALICSFFKQTQTTSNYSLSLFID